MSNSDVAALLTRLDLEQYVNVFAENDVDADVLPEISDDDLKDLGLSLGHRKKLLKAIRKLNGDAETAAAVARAEPSNEAERRHMTVLFCDMVGSTELAARLDPEDMSDVMHSYRSCCEDVVKHWGGYVARYLGDGALIYFGYPLAHEDDAERAVRAGVDLTNKLAKLRPAHDVILSARVGIATGLVMVGEVIGHGTDLEHTVVGATPNLAARLQAFAKPGSVVIADSTRRLIGDQFDLNDLGALDLKGFGDDIRAWRVIDERRMQSRFEAVRGYGTTPFTGRGQDIDSLLDCWAETKRGTGQMVLLTGEAGIGKSRIVQALRERIEQDKYWWLHYQCSPYHGNSAMYPIIEQIEFAAGLLPEDDTDKKLDKLEDLISKSTDRVVEAAPHFAGLLSIPHGTRYAENNLTALAQKERTLEVLIDQLFGLANDKPVLCVMEDAHWIDPSTQELLELVAQKISDRRVLWVITSRPGYEPGGLDVALRKTITLERLGRGQSTTIVEQLTGGKSLPSEVMQEIVAKTDGVPLFLEEMTKALLETSLLIEKEDRYVLAGALSSLAVPETLHDSLMARLDNLAPVKGLAQIASVIGREFSGDLLARVSQMPAGRLEDSLNRLIDAELIVRHSGGHENTFGFKHALVRDTAYDSLLRSKREQLHKRIAKTLQSNFAERVGAQPELLAHHLTEAREVNEAIAFWYKAGERALNRSANVEAIGHLLKGLKLIQTLPENEDRIQEELRFQISLGRAALATKGYAAPDVERAYGRARELCQLSGDSPQLHQVLMGLEAYYFARADMQTAYELALQSRSIAERYNDPIRLITSDHALGITLFHQGDLQQAMPHLDQAMLTYDEKRRELPQLARRIQNPGVGCRSYASLALWHLGYPEKAARMCEEAVDMARDSSQPFSVAYALCFAAWFAQYCRWNDKTHAYAEEAVELAEQQKFSFWLAISKCYLGWSDVTMHQIETGVDQISDGIALYATTGARISQPLWDLLLAEACLQTAQFDRGLQILSGAIDEVQRTGERFCEPELHRLKGEMILAKGVATTGKANGKDKLAQAEACMQQAMTSARKQNARMLELRAATSLGRLWRDHGGCAIKIHDLIAPVYEGFTEGFDEVDLIQAHSLLQQTG